MRVRHFRRTAVASRPRPLGPLETRGDPDALAFLGTNTFDEEGDELEDASALRQHVLDTARDLMVGARLKAIPDWRRCSFEVTDEAGTVVLTLPFSEAVA